MTRVFPNLFIPGAAKSGTTSLHDLLNCHPDICMSMVKEPVFWNSSSYKNPKKIGWYNDLFEDHQAQILGESTTSYMYYPEFISAINEYYADPPKFIFILRNPIDRSYSHFWWMCGRGQENRSFRESLTADANREFEAYGYLPNYYYHFGLYGKWIKRFYDNFGQDQVKLITLENLVSDRTETLNSCFRFLGVKEMSSIPEISANETSKLKYPKLFHFINKTASGKYRYTKVAKYLMTRQRIEKIKKKLRDMPYFKSAEKLEYPEMSIDERKWVKHLYTEDVAQLKQLSRRDFNEWIDFNNKQ
ncbi:MAG: hypothetical protein HKN54_03575 [Flavobacteriaceae bacterium]|nr:hypothetical protein [Flavobacteriaceae bacterium]